MAYNPTMDSVSVVPVEVRMLRSPREVSLYRELRLASLRTDPTAFHLSLADALKKPEEFFVAEITDPQLGCLGAFIGGKMIGMLTLKAGSSVAHLFSLYVLPEFRGQGIGKKLIMASLTQARSAGFSRVELTVMENNPARRLYHSLGFVNVGEVVGCPGEIILTRNVMESDTIS